MDPLAHWIVNDFEVWIGFAFGVFALVIYARRLHHSRGRNRALLAMVLLAVAWMTTGYAMLALNVFADEPLFIVLWMRPGGMSLLAIIAALGIGDRGPS